MVRSLPSAVLVVGQIPPPYHGQAVMIRFLMERDFAQVRKFNLPLRFSTEMSDIGRVRLSKLLHLVQVIVQIVWLRFRHGIDILYYPPAGPDRIPVYRDIAVLLATRWLFRKTVFHFHAAGVSTLYPSLSRPMRTLFRWAYFQPDLAIQLSARNPPDGEVLHAKQTVVIPYGIDDHRQAFARPDESGQPPLILFIGVLRDSKGPMVLLRALRRLRESGHSFRAVLVGAFQSAEFQREVSCFLAESALQDVVELPGVLVGPAKWEAYARADIFCFPSYFELESFGLVVTEAMQFGLPVVATEWRGIPDLVQDGETGFLVPIKDVTAVAGKLALLLGDASLRQRQGENGRKRFLERFTAQRFADDMEQAFVGLASAGPTTRDHPGSPRRNS